MFHDWYLCPAILGLEVVASATGSSRSDSFARIPSELLSIIVHNLRHQYADLTRLALVSRRWQSLVERKLYSYPTIEPTGNYFQSRIAQFLRTLILRPELRGRIKGIAMAPKEIGVNVDFCPTPATVASLSQSLPVVEMQIFEPRLAGLIITQLPNLDILSLRVYDGTWSSVDTRTYSPLHRCLFPDSLTRQGLHQVRDIRNVVDCDYKSLYGFQNLRVLLLNGMHFFVDQRLYTLPSLRVICLEHNYRSIFGDPSSLRNDKINKLTFELQDDTFGGEAREHRWNHPQLWLVMGCFPRVQCLSILIRNYWSGRRTGRFGTYLPKPDYFRNILNELSMYKETLRTLIINLSTTSECDFLVESDPIDSLHEFVSLKHIGLPQAVLHGETMIESSRARYPSFIEIFRFYCVTNLDNLLFLIKVLVLEEAPLPLQRIEVNVRKKEAYFLAQWQYQWLRSIILQRVRDKGIGLRFFDQENEVGVQWERGDLIEEVS